ncbi:hypothetical protein D0T66_13945 [Dysgonomonas sp. 25]|nr:hypothetical protein [Dysgonomonas sp. 25]
MGKFNYKKITVYILMYFITFGGYLVTSFLFNMITANYKFSLGYPIFYYRLEVESTHQYGTNPISFFINILIGFILFFFFKFIFFRKTKA